MEETTNTTNEETKSYKLTDEEQSHLSQILEDHNKHDFETKVAEQKAIEEEHGLPAKTVTTITDPTTGITSIVGDEDDSSDSDPKTTEEYLDELGRSIANNKDITIHIEDIRYAIANDPNYTSAFGKISEDACQKLADLANERLASDDPDLETNFEDIPKEVQDIIVSLYKSAIPQTAPLTEKVLAQVYNEYTNGLINDLYLIAATNSALREFNTQANIIYNEAQDTILPMIQNYEESKEEALRESLKNITDPKERQDVEDTLDAMADAYSLKPLIAAASKIRVKKFDIEKPSRVYNVIHSKYRRDPRYNIYSLTSAQPVLSNHLYNDGLITKEDHNKNITATKFLVIFAKYCANFHPQVVKEHTFIYYVVYNISLLDTYKNESYDKFAKPFLDSVIQVVNTRNK